MVEAVDLSLCGLCVLLFEIYGVAAAIPFGAECPRFSVSGGVRFARPPANGLDPFGMKMWMSTRLEATATGRAARMD